MLMKTSSRSNNNDHPWARPSRSGAIESAGCWLVHARPEGRAYGTNTARARLPRAALFDFDFGADVRELLLDRERLVLGDAFLDRLRRPLDQVLRFLQPQAGDFADDLDDVDLVGAHFGERRGELGLLLDRGRAAARRAASRHRHWHRRRRL